MLGIWGGRAAGRARAGGGPEPFTLARRPALDGLRGLGAALVTAAHLGQWLWPDVGGWLLFPGGLVGVDLFFALSGFLITALVLAELDRIGRIRLGTFLWRRVLRLSPTLVVVVATVLAAAVVGLIANPVRDQARRSLWTVLYLQTWDMATRLPQPELAHTWSLAVEMQFYLLWSVAAALVALVAPRRTRSVLAAAAVGLLAVVASLRAQRFDDGQNLLELYFTTPNRLDEPLVGCLGGLAFACGWFDRLSQRAFGALAVAGAAGVVAVAAGVDPFGPWLYRGGFTLVAVVATVATVGAAGLVRGPAFRALGTGPLALLGRCSYSLYLWHMPVFIWLSRETPTWAQPVRSAVGLALAGTLTAVTYLGVERPLQRLRHRRARPAPVVVRAADVVVDAPGVTVVGQAAGSANA